MAVIKKNKKGFFFTFIAIIITSIFFVQFIAIPQAKSSEQIELDAIKIALLNDFSKTLVESYIPSLMRAQTKKVMVEKMKTEANFIGHFGFDSEYDTIMAEQMDPMISEVLIAANNHLNVNTSLSLSNFKIQQVTPFLIEMSAWMEMKTSSVSGEIKFSYDDIIAANLSVVGMKDPLSVKHDGYDNARVIKPTLFVSFGAENTTKLLNSGEYRSHSSAPSYLSRYMGDFTAGDGQGIETLVDRNKYGVSEDVIDVDYEFFEGSHQCNADTGLADLYLANLNNPNVPNTYTLWLDKSHLGLYEVTPMSPWTDCEKP